MKWKRNSCWNRWCVQFSTVSNLVHFPTVPSLVHFPTVPNPVSFRCSKPCPVLNCSNACSSLPVPIPAHNTNKSFHSIHKFVGFFLFIMQQFKTFNAFRSSTVNSKETSYQTLLNPNKDWINFIQVYSWNQNEKNVETLTCAEKLTQAPTAFPICRLHISAAFMFPKDFVLRRKI